MPLVSTASVIGPARAAGAGAPAFNVLHLETAEALVSAAERAAVPLILQISENCVRYHGRLLPLLRATLALAETSEAEISVHLDHITDPALLREGVRAGARSVMIDASALPYEENVAVTAELTGWCHGREVFVEPSWARWEARTGCTPRARVRTPRRRSPSWRPQGWTRWRSPWAPRTRCGSVRPCSTRS